MVAHSDKLTVEMLEASYVFLDLLLDQNRRQRFQGHADEVVVRVTNGKLEHVDLEVDGVHLEYGAPVAFDVNELIGGLFAVIIRSKEIRQEYEIELYTQPSPSRSTSEAPLFDDKVEARPCTPHEASGCTRRRDERRRDDAPGVVPQFGFGHERARGVEEQIMGQAASALLELSVDLSRKAWSVWRREGQKERGRTGSFPIALDY